MTAVKAKWDTGALNDEGKAVYNSFETKYDFGGNLDGAVALCDAEAVYDNYQSGAKIQLQNAIRVLGAAGKTVEQIAEALVGWVPGQKAAKVIADPEAVLRQRYAAAGTDEEREKILANIMGEPTDTATE